LVPNKALVPFCGCEVVVHCGGSRKQPVAFGRQPIDLPVKCLFGELFSDADSLGFLRRQRGWGRGKEDSQNGA